MTYSWYSSMLVGSQVENEPTTSSE
uniref:Uncharacterized protein n=1 Tax=Arundo donax TaxID=35708 RepID=A0A0A9A691_ARUDO